MKKVTIPQLVRSKEKLVMLTAYDYWTAQLVDHAGADMILVGDSLGMVVQGKQNTLSVTVDEIVYHCKAVSRGRQRALIVGDMPYLSYHVSPEDTIRNAGKIIREGHVDAVKLEGGRKRIPMINALLDAEIPVMGHLGLTPQSIHAIGGFKVQGKDEESRDRIKAAALALQEAGVFALVLECIPYDLAREVSDLLEIPTIGIGAGPYCGGQVLVTHDLLGLNFGHTPKFVRQFANLGELGTAAVKGFCQSVKEGSFPTLDESYSARKNKAVPLYGGSQLPLEETRN
ncbi:MAG: 3-methyl-2-oxobutanoate hydroxymethyltransferase [Acidobacteriota bacterium]|nr:3-methyl-2-oxobutanoate hydroxymethyltransferase [Acidobacteriota bacterium]